MFLKKGWRHKCRSKKAFRNRNVFLTTTIKLGFVRKKKSPDKKAWTEAIHARSRMVKQIHLIAQCDFIFLLSFCFMRLRRFSDSG